MSFVWCNETLTIRIQINKAFQNPLWYHTNKPCICFDVINVMSLPLPTLIKIRQCISNSKCRPIKTNRQLWDPKSQPITAQSTCEIRKARPMKFFAACEIRNIFKRCEIRRLISHTHKRQRNHWRGWDNWSILQCSQ